MSELKQSINRTQIIGTLKEMNMEVTTKEVTLKGGNGVEKKVTCNQIGKKEFKNPMFIVEVNGMDVDVDYFPVAEKKIDDNGAIVDNPRYKALETVMETYIPKCKDSENATRVKIDGSLRANEYADKTSFEWKTFPSIYGFQITSSGVPEEDIADCEISGVIRSIIPEVKDEKETGRLKVELYSFDNNGATTPATFIVEEDLAGDFTDFYEAGQSVKIYYEVVTRQVGAKKPTGGGFGRRDSQMISGFKVTEYSVFRGDDPFDEENEYFVDIDTMKKAMNERELMIEQKIKEAKEGGSKAQTSSSPKGASAKSEGKANPFGNSSTQTATTKKSPF